MDIVKRNFFRLLRSGAFDSNELIEPMSVFKWQKLYQFSVMHDVVAIAYKGIENCKLQFFLHMTDKQWQEWQKAAEEDRAKSHELSDEEDEFLRSDHLTNPVLNHKLQNILDDENSNTTTRQLLLSIVSVVRHILNEGLPIRQILMLGIYIQSQSKDIDFTTLRKWLESLRRWPASPVRFSSSISDSTPKTCPSSTASPTRTSSASHRSCSTSPTPVHATGISRRMKTASSSTTATPRPCSATCAAPLATSTITPPKVSPTSSPPSSIPSPTSRNSDAKRLRLQL